MALTSRERLALTLDHQDPGNPVVDLGATVVSGIHVDGLHTLNRLLGLDQSPVYVSEPFQMLGRIDDDVRTKLQLDVVGVSPNRSLYGFPFTGWKPWQSPWGTLAMVPERFETSFGDDGELYLYAQGNRNSMPAARMSKTSRCFTNIVRGHVDYDEDDPERSSDFSQDYTVYTDEELRFIEDQCDSYYGETQCGIIGNTTLPSFASYATIPGPHLLEPKGLRDVVEFLVAHYTMPQYIEQVFGSHLEIAMENLKLYHQAVGEKIQAIVLSGTDFAVQSGPYMTVDTYRKFYKPCQKVMNDWIHKNTNWKTFYYASGDVSSVLADYHEIGVDILSPIQCTANLDPFQWKEQWGDKFVFWGGATETSTLVETTPLDVYRETYRRLSIFAPGGGFVCSGTSNIPHNVPASHLKAYFQAVEDYREYNRRKK